MTREYQRSTKECRFGELRPELVAAIRAYLEKHLDKDELGGVESSIVLCAETTSEHLKKGFMAKLTGGGDKIRRTAMVLTPSLLIWSTTDEKHGPATLAVRLEEAEITDFKSPLAQIEDDGLQVVGFSLGATERMSAFIGLGQEAVAQKVRETVKEAARNAK
ncbi:MAG: hypothetical protein K8L91_20645 [Anaerolineae bacterium]|nr:hypothetical protein [Anaerolineae bacterium]